MGIGTAAVFTGIDQPFELNRYALTPPPRGMAKMALLASGVCGTDIHIHQGKIPLNTPAIIGHEFVGRVEEISLEDSKACGIMTGDHVIVDIACPCGHCLLCREGDDANCLHMGVTNGGNPEISPHFYGGFAEYNYSPIQNLVKIPDELDPMIICTFACAGPTTMHAFSLARQAGWHAEKARVAVVQGFGTVGAFATIYLASLGIEHIVVITGKRNSKRETLARQFGAAEVLSMDDDGTDAVVRHVRSLNGGIGADLSVEASGNPKAFAQGLEMLRNRGVYLVPGQYSNSGNIEISPQIITFNALHIIGSSQYSLSDVHQYLEFLQKNPDLVHGIAELITAYPLQDINKAFDDAKVGKNIKTILVR